MMNRRIIKMKKMIVKCLALILTLVLFIGMVGCGSSKQASQENPKPGVGGSNQAVEGLPQGFPSEVPIYKGAQVIDADNFNGNNYTILYSVNADFDKVVDFYTGAFDLDGSGTSDVDAYYEGFEFGDIFIKGLTIEDTGDAINVYMTVQDNGQNVDDYDDNEEITGGAAGSDIMTYNSAQEVSLDDDYPQDVVPIPSAAKVISCSMVPNTRSGFVDLIMPGDKFGAAVSFYTEELGLKSKDSTSSVQESASFKGESDGIKFSILVSHLLGGGHDTLIQITVNEK